MKETIENKIKAILEEEHKETGVKVKSVSIEWAVTVGGDAKPLWVSMNTEKLV